MCGRFACLLDPDVICSSCSYYDPNTKSYEKPEWKDHSDVNGLTTKYYTSANIPPTRFTPIMFKPEQKNDEDNSNSGRVMMPMHWGIIPPWHKGEPNKHKMSTNNARLEGIHETKLYRRALNHRRFCVILAQGFYEWKTVGIPEKSKEPKQPYFIYMPQEDQKIVEEKRIWDLELWNDTNNWSKEKGWSGPKIFAMAGLYDIWKNEEGQEVYSYTIFTMESNESLNWIHHRMPAILDTPEQIEAWLNPEKDVDLKKHFSMLKPVKKLEYYPVDKKVNNSRYHETDAIRPINIKTDTKTSLQNWLKKPANSSDDNPKKEKDEDQPDEKKPKIEKNDDQKEEKKPKIEKNDDQKEEKKPKIEKNDDQKEKKPKIEKK